MKTQRRDRRVEKQIAERLKMFRRARGLTQEDVRFSTDINIARAESGCGSLSIGTIVDLCDYYEISLEEFFRGVTTQRAQGDGNPEV